MEVKKEKELEFLKFEIRTKVNECMEKLDLIKDDSKRYKMIWNWIKQDHINFVVFEYLVSVYMKIEKNKKLL